MTKNNLFRIILSIIIICPMIIASSAYSYEVVLTAIDSESMRIEDRWWHYRGYGDNILRAYSAIETSTSKSEHLDGFIKFDFLSIPDTCTITSMTLTTYLAGSWGLPRNDPSVKIYRSAFDDWSRPYRDAPYPGINEVLTNFHTGFPFNTNQSATNPAADRLPYEWKIDVRAADWSSDLADNILSLVLHNEKPLEYNYIYFYGSDSGVAPPTLKINHHSYLS